MARAADPQSPRSRVDRGNEARRPTLAQYLERSRSIPGWLHRSDAVVLAALCELQTRAGLTADLMEIGVYHGRSAILLGYLLREGERLFACDLFEDQPEGRPQGVGERRYPGLTQAAFESNYRAHHEDPPVVLRGPFPELALRGLPPRGFRLIHVDAGHEPSAAEQNLAAARTLLADGGVVVFEDDHGSHVPGVPRAVLDALVRGELEALCMTPSKTYATAGADVLGLVPSLMSWAAASPDVHPVVRRFAGQDLLLLYPLPRHEGPWTGLDRKAGVT